MCHGGTKPKSEEPTAQRHMGRLPFFHCLQSFYFQLSAMSSLSPHRKAHLYFNGISG
jgi:hypothetical protein